MANVAAVEQSHIFKAYFAAKLLEGEKYYEKDFDFLVKKVVFELCKESILVSWEVASLIFFFKSSVFDFERVLYVACYSEVFCEFVFV